MFEIENLEEFERLAIAVRSEEFVYEKMEMVRSILNDVRARGDEALIEYTKRFDGIECTAEELLVSEEEVQAAFESVEQSFIDAIGYAIGNVEKYHRRQMPEAFEMETTEGVTVGRRWVPIESVGLYIPGGRAPYVTVAYMLGVPARIAGCRNRIACVPPDKETGRINPYVLVSARLSGINAIYKIGGAQAIGAMAYGTQSVPRVGKIFGPGNVYVTAAKLLVYGKVDIDAPAGPSEALIIADDSADADFVAADIISQAEHDVNSAAIFLTTSKTFAEEVEARVAEQTARMPRKETIRESLSRFGACIICPTMELCIELANAYGPEHIQLMTRNSEEDAGRIVNAGSICIGTYSPIAMGDYVSGVNNVIPTGGAAKNFSPVHLESFMKCMETQRITKRGLQGAAGNLKIICDVEGFDAHYNSVEVRLKGSAKEANG